ncbi:hypothetical protein T265_04247 [Opisthorchis viverrini]|uniref:Stress-associated endoplasmic reticulum protein n=1 Tax=Opisthorchis viverrini TaxID=6198 RepID=A0A074ZTA0_OPIVI|nr:hypothetical protein T265_04247 [Opisthorchis viverrini]KER29062.1 hypothetical protein T265_04247 [Opisthorchis viverrini]
MSANQRMKVQNERAHGNVRNRGNVPKSLKSQDSQSNMNAWILGLIVFVVCGSGWRIPNSGEFTRSVVCTLPSASSSYINSRAA